MKSKISIWDCRRAIEIAGDIPLTIRGALFVGLGPDPVAHWLSETVLITQLEIKKGRWGIGNIGFTRHGQEYLTKLARDIIADDERSYSLQQSDSTMAPASKHSGWKRCNGCLRNASGRPREAVRGL